MTGEHAKGPALRVRFEVPRSEVERARASAGGEGRMSAGFDREHLRGRVHFDVAVPFEPDPVLDFLREKRGLQVGPPHTTSLDQPVAYVVGQLAAATVMAAHGESAPMVLLSGGSGALGVAWESEGTLALSLPLEQYAGVALVPAGAAAHAVAAAGRALLELFDRELPAARAGPFGRFLERECAILDAVSSRAGVAPPELEPLPVAPGDFASLSNVADAEEKSGAQVVPYWATNAVEGDPTRVAFEPVRTPRRKGARGALALSLRPDGARLLVATVPGRPEEEAAFRAHLARPAPFVARLVAAGSSLRVEAKAGSLPMALEGDG